MPWQQGFDLVQALQGEEGIFPITVFLPSLRKEYMPLLPVIGSKLGRVLRKDVKMVDAV